MPRKLKFGRVFRKKKNGKEYPIWWIRYSKSGVRHEESSESEVWDDAYKLLVRKYGESTTPAGRDGRLAPRQEVTLGQLTQLVIDDYVEAGKANLKNVRANINLHLLKELGKDTAAAEIGTAELKVYRQRRKHQGASSATVNREMAALKRAFRLGLQHEPPLVTRVPHIEMLPENNVRTGFLEPAQYDKLLLELPEHLRPLLVLGYQYGTRHGNLVSLRWGQVDLESPDPTITFPPGSTKNGRGITLPLWGEALSELRRLRERAHGDWVFVDDRGRHVLTFRKAWATACKAAGAEELHFHDLRRSAVRRLSRAGVVRPVAMKITGHLTESVYRRYDIVSPGDLAEVPAKLAAYETRSSTAPRS